MTEQARFPHVAETNLTGLAFAAVRALLIHEAQEHDLALPENSDTKITLTTEYGDLSFAPIEGGVRAVLMSNRADALFILKEGLIETLSHFAPELVEEMVWSDAKANQGHPPNFQFATVKSVRPLCAHFRRVVLKVDDLSTFANAAIHFRIILPPQGAAAPEWPIVNDKGVTVWPKGEKTLHRPVYTVRRVDPARQELEFDVFLHDGGRTTDWTGTVLEGAKIGITGPGGGGIPAAEQITLYADETAFPAVARILETLPETTTGKVVLLAEAGATCGYPFPEHPNLTPQWLDHKSGVGLAEQAITDRPHHADHMLWFASEKADTAQMRAFCRTENIDTKQHYVATYWSRQ
jgi:NADPH-dependent ferric siderophore reductase